MEDIEDIKKELISAYRIIYKFLEFAEADGSESIEIVMDEFDRHDKEYLQ